jgi:hypothetical protein
LRAKRRPHEAPCRGWGLAALLAVLSFMLVPSSAGANELSYISKTKTVPSTLPNLNGRGTAEARCPSDHPDVSGGGVKIEGDNSGFDLEVASTNPEGSPPGAWLGEANNTSGSDAEMTTTAVCGKGRFKYRVDTKLISPGGQATVKVACPSGTKLTGGGVSTEGNSPRVELAATRPFDGADGDPTTDDGWLGSANNGTNSAKTMGVFAACAESGHYKYVHSAPKPLPDNTEATAIARCPAGTLVSGGGVENSGIDVGAAIETTFPLPDTDWLGRANNDNTGQAETVQAFAICLVEEIRDFSGTANGGTVTFKTKFEGGKTVKVLPGLTFTSVPIHCSNGDTIHGVIVDERRRVTNNRFFAHTDSEVGQPQAAFTLDGHFNDDGTRANGTYREHGNLKSSNGTFVFRHCDTGTVHWSAKLVQ